MIHNLGNTHILLSKDKLFVETNCVYLVHFCKCFNISRAISWRDLRMGRFLKMWVNNLLKQLLIEICPQSFKSHPSNKANNSKIFDSIYHSLISSPFSPLNLVVKSSKTPKQYQKPENRIYSTLKYTRKGIFLNSIPKKILQLLVWKI